MSPQVMVLILVLPILALAAEEILYTSPPLVLTSTEPPAIPPISNNALPSLPTPVESSDLPDVLPLQRNNISTIGIIAASPESTSPITPQSSTLPTILASSTTSHSLHNSPQPSVIPSPSTTPVVPKIPAIPIFEPDITIIPAISIDFESLVKPTVLKNKNPFHVRKLLPDRNTCGFENQRRRSVDSPIATIDEFPWVALLRYEYGFGLDAGFRCAGTLISDRYVVTAAHCVAIDSEQLYLKSVRLGDWVISSPTDCVYDYYGEECADKAVEVGIKKKILHDEYDYTCGRNDIALILLERKVDFTVFIRPICLPVANLRQPTPGSTLTTSGWGATRYGFQSDIKSKIHVPVLWRNKCTNPFSSYAQVFDNQVCVGRRTNDDFCTVDSGGPLMACDEENKPQWYLEGVISVGFSCGRQGYPGVYTRVTGYIHWILNVIATKSL